MREVLFHLLLSQIYHYFSCFDHKFIITWEINSKSFDAETDAELPVEGSRIVAANNFFVFKLARYQKNLPAFQNF